MDNGKKRKKENCDDDDDDYLSSPRKGEDFKNIRITSKIDTLEKTPDQVLKFMIYRLYRKNVEQKRKLEEYERDIKNSDLWWCGECGKYIEKDNKQKCGECGDKMCENCNEDHLCIDSSEESKTNENERKI